MSLTMMFFFSLYHKEFVERERKKKKTQWRVKKPNVLERKRETDGTKYKVPMRAEKKTKTWTD